MRPIWRAIKTILSEKHRIFLPILLVLIGACTSGHFAFAEESQPQPSNAMSLPKSIDEENVPLSQADKQMQKDLAGHEPSSRRGAPVNPVGDPKYADKPLVWVDFVTYVVEMGMLSFAFSFFACAIVFAFKRIWVGATALFFLSAISGVLGLAVPGLCLMLVKTSLSTIPQQWLLVNSVMAMYALCVLVAVVIPVVVSLRKAFTRNRKIQIAVLSILGGLLGPLFWVVAMSLAFSKVNEEPREETV